MGSSKRRAILLIALFILAPVTAGADVLFTYGFSPRTIGMGNAFTAVADDVSSSYYNPGGAIQNTHPIAEIGYLYSFAALHTMFSDRKASLGSTHGILVGVNLPFPFKAWLKDRIWFSFCGFFPDGVLLSIAVPYPTDPQYLLLQNSGRSVSLVPTLTVRIVDGVGIGGGAQLFDNTRGQINASASATGEIQTTVGQELPTSFAPMGGVFIDIGKLAKKVEGFRIGFTFRRRFFTYYKIPVNTYLGGIPLKVGFEATSLYIPDQYVLGLAYSWHDRVRVALDASYNRWSEFPDPNLHIRVNMSIPLLPVSFQNSKAFKPNFSDTLTWRAGIEWKAISRPDLDFNVRAGYFYDPSPVPPQTGATNYLDTDRHSVSASPGVVIRTIGTYKLPTPFMINAALQYQYMVPRIFHKGPDIDLTNPGYPKIGISGSVYSLSLDVGTSFDFE
jgi:long-chain fatty acid transport protein